MDAWGQLEDLDNAHETDLLSDSSWDNSLEAQLRDDYARRGDVVEFRNYKRTGKVYKFSGIPRGDTSG
jgi:hypothetical protein